jgi:hypothetical protein
MGMINRTQLVDRSTGIKYIAKPQLKVLPIQTADVSLLLIFGDARRVLRRELGGDTAALHSVSTGRLSSVLGP